MMIRITKALEILRDMKESAYSGVNLTLTRWSIKDFNEAIDDLEHLKVLSDPNLEDCSDKYLFDLKRKIKDEVKRRILA